MIRTRLSRRLKKFMRQFAMLLMKRASISRKKGEAFLHLSGHEKKIMPLFDVRYAVLNTVPPDKQRAICEWSRTRPQRTLTPSIDQPGRSPPKPADFSTSRGRWRARTWLVTHSAGITAKASEVLSGFDSRLHAMKRETPVSGPPSSIVVDQEII